MPHLGGADGDFITARIVRGAISDRFCPDTERRCGGAPATVEPDLAVLRLMTSWDLVAADAGSDAGQTGVVLARLIKRCLIFRVIAAKPQAAPHVAVGAASRTWGPFPKAPHRAAQETPPAD
jgi:hypothetical protein